MPAFRLFEKWRECVSDKDAYLEALRALQVRVPDLFPYLARVCATSRRKFFATDPVALFLASPHLADSASHFARIVPGWYADTNLSNRQKERNLMYACGTAKINYFTDFEIRFTPGHYSPLSRQEAARLADKMLAELDRL